MIPLTVNTGAGANLVLPLCRHNLGVGTRDLNAGVQASLVVGIHDISAEDLAGTVAAVVGTLRSWETVPGPAVRPAGGVEESVFLLETEPEFVLGVLVHKNSGIVAEVVGVGGSVAHPGLTHDEDVVAKPERVGVHGDWAEVDI